ncbi:type IV pili methyl-accepting chemotaxis transducer N-terminal domain-containing protein [Burkholderia sp. SIMBA_062]|uniref:type IV pili methyl-accepting chemotaxis transducer N-terminal domain-containing protein n=1 Tax=Burkholderia sp. SIMBA_062 TaxID=3085803 RepID=UPI0039783D2D
MPNDAEGEISRGPLLRQRLTTRIVVLSVVTLALVLTMIGGTLYLSWQLQGAGAAINDAGSLRMRAEAVAVALMDARPGEPSSLQAELSRLDATLDRLQRGDPDRPLFLPNDAPIQRQFEAVVNAWRLHLEPAALADLRGKPVAAGTSYRALLPRFVEEADSLVRLIEQENARKTEWLRISQISLAALSCVGTVAIMYLLYLWFVVPVQRLQEGLAHIEARRFDIRLPVDTRDEFGHLAMSFNRMTTELQALYRDLEQRVDEKTATLAAQNRELTALYEMAAFLNQPDDVDVLCRGFLARLMGQFDADGGTLRIVSGEDNRLHLVASEGVPAELADAERCIFADDCLCGTVTKQGASVVQMLRDGDGGADAFAGHCRRAGFVDVAAFRIASQGEMLGSFSLHFRHERPIPASEAKLLETLGKHLGTALKSRRLATVARQLAVSEERNLVAQGLHDSIAQGLNFLKMQVHLLDRATREQRLDEIRELVPLLEGGIKESYDDVRELLLNFRSKLDAGELRNAVDDTIERFRRQTGIPVTLDYREEGGPLLPADQQLQVLFILQEALSNVRKHAEAQHVRVTIINARDFRLQVEDDGLGFDPDEIAAAGEAHVGLRIMRERASRLAATLRLLSSPGRGACVELVLPADIRQAA